jgi:hypothetical protein
MKSRSRKLIGVLILSIFLIGIGYAFLSSTLTINGIGAFSKNSWIIYFDDIRPAEGSVETASQPAIITNPEKTNIQFDVDLNTPGDFYEFDVYIKNDGTIDAMIDEVIMPELTEEQKKYMKFSYTYVDGTKIKKCDELKAQNFRDTRLRVEYLEDADLDIMPEEGLTHFDVTITYVQESECELDKIDVELDPNGGIYNETTEVTTITLSDGQEYTVGVPTREGYTFVKWLEVTDSDSYENNIVSFKGKNVRLQAQWIVSDDVVARIDREESIYYVTIQAAIDDARDNEIIHLLKNTSEVFTNNKNVTLNLEGYKVTGSGTNEEGYSLTIINGSIENEDGVGFVNKGTLTLGINDDHLCDVGDLSHTCEYVDGFVSLIGTTRGLTQDGTFNFYDGFIEGELAIFGAANDTPTYIHPLTQDETYYIVFVDRDLIRQDQKAYLSDQPNRAVSKTIVGGNVYYLDLSLNFDASVITDYKIYAVRNFEGAYEVTVPENEEIEFDIIGKKVTLGNNINNNGKLKIINSQEEGYIELAHIIKNKGTLELDGLTINEITTDSNMIEPIGDSNIILKNTKLTTNNGLVLDNKYPTTLTMDDDSIIQSSNNKAINNESELTINGGTIKAKGYGLNVLANSNTNIDNCNFVANNNSYNIYGNSNTTSVVTINNSTFNGGISGVNLTYKNSTMNLSNNNNGIYRSIGTFENGIINANNGCGIELSTVTVNGGTITSKKTAICLSDNSGAYTVTINDGYIGGDQYGINIGSTYNNYMGANIYGGTVYGGIYGINMHGGDEKSKVYIGEDDDEISITSPVVIGGTYGVYRTNGNVYFYDGILKGKTYGYDGTIYDTPDGALFVEGEEEIEEELYQTIHLEQEIKYLKYNNEVFNSFNKLFEKYPDDVNYDIELVDNGKIANIQTIPEGTSVTINFKGYNIKALTTLINYSDLVLKDTSDGENKGKLYSDTSVIIKNYGNIVFNDITMEQKSNNYCIYHNENDKTFTFNSGKILSDASSVFYVFYNTVQLDINDIYIKTTGVDNSRTLCETRYTGACNLTMNGGYIETLSGITGGKLNMIDGEIIYGSESRGLGLTMTGGYIHSLATSKTSFMSGGSFNMTGGTIELNFDNKDLYISKDTRKIDMTGGTIKSSGRGFINVYKMNITGGTIETKYDSINVNYRDGNGNQGLLIIGSLDNTLNINTPVIKSDTYAITKTSGKVYFYDGILKSLTDYIDNVIDQIPDETIIKDDTTEIINDVEYKVAYLINNEPFLQVGSNSYSSFNKLIELEESNELDVVVIANGKISAPQTLSKNINLDLNGYQIEITQTITNDASLIITDSSDDHSGKMYSFNSTIIKNNAEKSLKIYGGTFEQTVNDKTLYTIENYGNMETNGEHTNFNIFRENPDRALDTSSVSIFNRTSEAELVINNGTFFITRYGVQGGKVTFNSGKLYSTYSSYTVAFYVLNTLDVYGGLIDVSDVAIDGGATKVYDGTIKGKTGYDCRGNSRIDIFDGTFEVTNNGVTCTAWTATINMTGGSIKAGNDAIYGNMNGYIKGGTLEGNVYGIYLNSGTLNIGENDGTFSIETPKIIGNTYGIYRNGGNLNFYDGIIKGQTGSTHGVINSIADNSSIKEDTEIITKMVDEEEVETVYFRKYLVEDYEYIENQTTGVRYRKLELAIENASDGDSLLFTNDGNEYNPITIDKNITIDFNGNDLYVVKNITIPADIEVNIVNNSDEKSKLYSINTIGIIINNGNITINNVDIEALAGGNCITNNGDALIDGSNINCSSRVYYNEYRATNANVVFKNSDLKGGSFSCYGNLELNNTSMYLDNSVVYGDGTTKILNKSIIDYNPNNHLTSHRFYGNVIIDDSAVKNHSITVGNSDKHLGQSIITNTHLYGTLTSNNNLIMNNVDIHKEIGAYSDSYMLTTMYTANIENLTIDTPERSSYAFNHINLSGDYEVSLKNININLEGGSYNKPIINIDGPTVTADNININYNNNNDDNNLHIGIKVVNGVLNLKSGNIKINAYYARGIQLEQNGIVNMGEAEPLTSGNRGTSNADVSLTDPYVEAIGRKNGYAIYNENGYYNFYDGKIKGSTKARYNEASAGVEFLWEITSYHDNDNNEYSILEYMG